MSSEFGVSYSENSEKSSEKVVGGWVDSKGYRGVRRYPVWYISGIEQAQKRGQDTGTRVQFGDRWIWNNEILDGVKPLVIRIDRRPLPGLGNCT